MDWPLQLDGRSVPVLGAWYTNDSEAHTHGGCRMGLFGKAGAWLKGVFGTSGSTASVARPSFTPSPLAPPASASPPTLTSAGNGIDETNRELAAREPYELGVTSLKVALHDDPVIEALEPFGNDRVFRRRTAELGTLDARVA